MRRILKDFFTFKSVYLILLLVSVFSIENIAHAKKKKKSTKTKKVVKTKKIYIKQVKNNTKNEVFIGGGLFNLYPPLLSVGSYYSYNRYVHVGGEVGYLLVSANEFRGDSLYYGLNAKYIFLKDLFVGLAFGVRTFEIETPAKFYANDETVEIKWKRNVSQQLLSLKFGFISQKQRTSTVVVAGALIPFNSKLDITRDIDSIAGVPDGELEKEATNKANDVGNVTNKIGFLLGFKYYIKVK